MRTSSTAHTLSGLVEGQKIEPKEIYVRMN